MGCDYKSDFLSSRCTRIYSLCQSEYERFKRQSCHSTHKGREAVMSHILKLLLHLQKFACTCESMSIHTTQCRGHWSIPQVNGRWPFKKQTHCPNLTSVRFMQDDATRHCYREKFFNIQKCRLSPIQKVLTGCMCVDTVMDSSPSHQVLCLLSSRNKPCVHIHTVCLAQKQ